MFTTAINIVLSLVIAMALSSICNSWTFSLAIFFSTLFLLDRKLANGFVCRYTSLWMLGWAKRLNPDEHFWVSVENVQRRYYDKYKVIDENLQH